MKDNREANLAAAKAFLQMAENVIVSNDALVKVSNARNGKTRELLILKANRKTTKTLESIGSCYGEGISEECNIVASRLYNGLLAITIDDSEESYEKLRKQIGILETTISQRLNVSNETTPIERLRIIYNYLSDICTEEDLSSSFRAYAVAFGKGGDIDGAIDRLEIIKQIQVSRLGAVTNQNKIFLAYLKLLRGEPDEWLALEKENTAKANKKSEKKKRQKARKLQAHVNATLAAQELHKEELRKAAQAEQQKQTLEAARKNERERNASDKGKEEVSYDNNPSSSEPVISREEEKRQKQERHNQAKKTRAERERAANAEPAFLEEIIEPSAEEAAINTFQDLQIGDLFHLTGVAADVEQHIVNNTWKITREDLEKYFVAMNCVYKEGKGSHGKLQLPKSIHVEKDGQVLSIFIESGGALTLPSWEKGYVPEYLKKQILIARQKLRLNAINAMMDKGHQEMHK